MKNKSITQFFSLSTTTSTSTITTSTNIQSPSAKKQRSNTQTYLNLGQPDFFKTCKECKMTWNSAEATDASLHRSYHKFCTAGIIFRAAELAKLKGCLKDSTYSVHTSLPSADSSWLLAKNNRILHFVNIELGCCSLQLLKNQWPEYSVYFATQNDNGALIGYLLVKDINSAHLYNYNEKEGEFVDLNAPIPASLGVSRIWTSPRCRRKGIATALLNAALAEKGVAKEMIAFSQPTSAGKHLFLSFLGNDRLLVFLDR